MLSEIPACEAKWVAFFVFAGLNVTFDLSYRKHAEGFVRCQIVLAKHCDGFRVMAQQTSNSLA